MELLTALIVLGVGVLGIAALYADRIREQADDPKGVAVRLAEELAASIAAHPGTEVTPGNDFDNGLNAVCEPRKEGSGSSKEPAQVTACWQQRVEEQLPNGTGTVERIAAGNAAQYRVIVSWSAAGVGAASYVVNVAPAARPAG